MKTENSTELEMFAFFEKTPDLVCIAGKDGFFKKINPAVIYKLGYSEAELFSQPISNFIYTEDRDLTNNTRTALLKGKPLLNFVNRYVTKTGEIIWLEWTSIFISDKELVFAIAKDISDRKLKEIELEKKSKKYQTLATHFKKSIEKERKYLSYELHEQLAQLVSALKMDIDWISKNEQELKENSKARIHNASYISKMLIDTIERISFSLSPKMLDDFGLNATLEWLCNEFYILNEIPCVFESDINDKSISEEMKIDFFRICQESLTNVISHIKPRKIIIHLKEDDQTQFILISYDGDLTDMDVLSQNTGLVNIRERATSINGSLSIEKLSETATRLNISIVKQYQMQIQ